MTTPLSNSTEGDGNLKAAIIAAVQAFLDEEAKVEIAGHARPEWAWRLAARQTVMGAWRTRMRAGRE